MFFDLGSLLISWSFERIRFSAVLGRGVKSKSKNKFLEFSSASAPTNTESPRSSVRKSRSSVDLCRKSRGGGGVLQSSLCAPQPHAPRPGPWACSTHHFSAPQKLRRSYAEVRRSDAEVTQKFAEVTRKLRRSLQQQDGGNKNVALRKQERETRGRVGLPT